MLTLSGIVFGQTPIGGIFEAVDRLAADLPRVLEGRGDLLLGGIALNGVPVQLGDLFADLTANRLTARSGFDGGVVKQHISPQYPPDQASWTLSGSLYPAGLGYLLVVQLLDTDGIHLRGWEFVLEAEGIEDLLSASVPVTTAVPWDRFEPNDEPDSAVFLELPFHGDGLILDGGDEDWFAIEVAPNRGDSVLILNAATTGNTETYLELYDEDGDLVEKNDDYDDYNALIYRYLSPGTWFLRISPYGSSSPEEVYTLAVEKTE